MALPEPVAGLVVSFAYLWRHQREAGLVEATKTRPCAIVLSVEAHDGNKIVTVAPITHTAPKDPTVAVEIPPGVKRHLGLDGERSWIMLDDFNQFGWPGFDLRPIPGETARFHFGMLPPNLFLRIVRRILELRREGRMWISSRDEI